MRVPLSWLKEYVDVNLSIPEIDDLLTNAGLEVKTVDYIGIEGSDLVWDRDKILLGRLLKVEQHPNADRLVLATVDYGADEPEVVVTGAPNLFAYLDTDIDSKNIYSPIALEGSTLYDGYKAGKTSKLKGKELRGIYNRCMLCSEKELGISDEHEGIILIKKDSYSPDYQAGTPLQDVLGDAVYEIDIIPNIARCASMIGVARELAALTNKPLRLPDYNVVMEGQPVDGRVKISTTNPELNPRFVGLIINDVDINHPTPYWMQHRLRLAGQRSINVIVDISNYVMLEMGQPNHTFDYDFLRQRADEYAPDGPIHIHTRLPKEGETLKTLDGVEHKLLPYTILVTDPQGNLSMGGIMGGDNSEIKDETTNVLLEAAAWNFINIRRSSTRLGIHTDASFRFSRGVHPSQALLGAKRAAELLRRFAGGTVANGIIDYYPQPPEQLTLNLDVDYARRLSGLDLTGAQMAALLTRLDFTVVTHDKTLSVTVPDHRLDIEGPHDLVEEICRMVGYDKIPSTLLQDSLPPQRGNYQVEQEERIKDYLVQVGLQEAITYRLTGVEREAGLWVAAEEADNSPYIALTNPNSPELAVMRHSLLSSVLKITADNSRYQEHMAFFEIGPVYIAVPNQQLPDEQMKLAIVMTGRRQAPSWHGDDPDTLDFFDLKGVLEQLFGQLHLDISYTADNHPTYRPGRTARLHIGKQELGWAGELHPLVVDAYNFRIPMGQPVLAAEIKVTDLIAAIPSTFAFRSVTPYPAVHEDLALIVPVDVTAAAVAAAIANSGGALLTDVELFDLYEGNPVPAGYKSLAYHLTFQAPNRTLTDKQIKKSRGRIIASLDQQLNVKLRE
ncbi:MAG TPA: phenylalanine--tRNA ligase subunit beta [Anaerolineae bacterium]|nr:phenylalanine--tRNA ligase subunit beta [Anaerolineae bacterium]